MKKLSNISPFLLLLFPVFIMMLFTFATNNDIKKNDEMTVKTTYSLKDKVAKIAISVFK